MLNDFNTRSKVLNTLEYSSFGLLLTNSLLFNMYPNNSNIYDLIVGGIGFLSVSLPYIILSNNKYNTKDILEIKNLYNTFIKNYNKLNNIFDFNNPIEIYILFNYLLYSGYLSKDKTFEFNNNLKDIDGIISTNIINGNGVCRHISSMLSDILKDRNIENYKIGVYCESFDYNFKINEIEEKKYDKEELIEYITKNIRNITLRKKIINEISNYIDSGKNIEISLNKTSNNSINDKLIGNHVINYVIYNENNYFLDPTQFRIYQNNDDKFYDINGTLTFKLMLSKILNNGSDYDKLIKSFKKNYNTISIIYEKEILEKTKEICKNNRDIFDKFYDENKELYNDITNKLIKIKR